MLVRYWQATLIAALMSLFGNNVVWAQTKPADGCIGLRPLIYRVGNCLSVKFSCETGDCCKEGNCCKDSKCCKEGASCSKKYTCDKNCALHTENKCECTKGEECCCKKGECKCGKSCECCGTEKTSNAKPECCPFVNKLAKKAAIIMVMPSPMQMIGRPYSVKAIEWRSPMPAQPHVALPTPLPPPPPMLTPPGIPVPTMCAPVMPPQSVGFAPPQVCCPYPAAPTCCPCPAPTADVTAAPSKTNTAVETCFQLMGLASDLGFLMHPPSMPSFCESVMGIATDLCPLMCSQSSSPCVTQSTPCHPPCGYCISPTSAPVCHPNCGVCGSMVAMGQPTVGYYTVATSATLSNVHVNAVPSSEELEMKVGGTCITCIRSKKMSIKIGEDEITLSRFDDRVRVRGDELKATADSVSSDSKNRLILEGNVVLHYKKDSHAANVTGERIELNLRSGSLRIDGVKTLSCPAVHLDGVDTESK